MIEQLWYGWAVRGVEGFNTQQIIAASPGLTDRGALLTKIALAQCIAPTAPTVGWCAHNDVHVVFRRSPAGLDGRGRPGNYFVHVLVADRVELPVSVLATVVTSTVLLGGLPDDVPETLPHVVLAEPPAAEADDPALLVVLGGYLGNLRAGRLTALATGQDRAAVLASSIAATMPGQLGLPGFSISEKQDRAAHYDMVSGPPPSPLFGEVGPGDQVNAADGYSAALLMAARHDRLATECVELLAADQTSRRGFALAVAEWCAIERGDPGAITANTLRLLLDRPGIRRRVVGLPALPHIVELAFSGDRLAVEVAEACCLDGEPRILDLVCDHVRAEPTGAASLHALVRARALAAAAVSTLVQGGEHLDLAALDDNQRLELVDLFPLDSDASPVVTTLLRKSELGAAVVGRSRYPLNWQVTAARWQPNRIPPERFGALLQRNPNCVLALVAGQPDTAVLRCVEEALQWIELGSARQVVLLSSGQIPSRTEPRWWDTVCGRLDPLEEFAFIAERVRSLGDVGDGRVVDAFVHAAGDALQRQLGPPSFVELQAVFDIVPATDRAWRAVTDAFVRLDEKVASSTEVRRTLDVTHQLLNQSHRQILRELLVGRVLAVGDPQVFERGMGEVELCHGLSVAAAMLLRGATSLPTLTASTVARLLAWGVRAIDRATSPDAVVAALNSDQVHSLVARTECGTPEGLRDRRHSRTARRWLDQVTVNRRSVRFWSASRG